MATLVATLTHIHPRYSKDAKRLQAVVQLATPQNLYRNET